METAHLPYFLDAVLVLIVHGFGITEIADEGAIGSSLDITNVGSGAHEVKDGIHFVAFREELFLQRNEFLNVVTEVLFLKLALRELLAALAHQNESYEHMTDLAL